MSVMQPKDVARELCENLRENNTLRHRLGVEEGPEQLSEEPTVVAYTDTEGQDWFIQVQQG